MKNPANDPRRRALLAMLCPATLLAGAPAAGAKTPGEVGVGQPLRDATMNGLNGPPRRLSEFVGRPLIINVWASWCGPCRLETASLERLAWSDAARGITIIGISTDDYRDKALAWLKASNATFNHYIDQKLELENLLGADRLPLTVIVGADGRVREKVYGAREWDSADSVKLIQRALRAR